MTRAENVKRSEIMSRRFSTRALASLVVLAGALPVAAQQPPPSQPLPWPTEQRPAPPPQPKAQAQPKSQPKAPPAAQPAPKAASKDDAGGNRPTDGQLRQRVEQLEEQLADMQVMIGTLKSLGKSGGASSAPAPGRGGAAVGGGADHARIDSLETQIRALSSQVEQLSNQLRQAGRRTEIVPAEPPAAAGSGAGFGSMTVTPGQTASSERGDPIGRLITPDTPAPSPASATPLPAAAANAGNPKELYETAYGYLLQQDYGAAEVAFEEFLRRHPNDRQTADAQYWYAETLYVQRRYKPAAQAFLRVIEKHQASNKVPNSLLKVAMSLEQLGQKDCGLFTELDTRHPNAPNDVKSKARAVKQRMGC